jgi:hypothetical protein
MKRRAFNPTAEQRGWVEALSSHGVPEAEICLLIKYPETGAPIGLETLRKAFRGGDRHWRQQDEAVGRQ